ncbi:MULTISPECIES: nitronate monooxygenase family protein [Amycolatopsis]|nr:MULTISPECIES: nitronate monooxygenase [Amycolatopsis]MCF6421250.1 nitronate monooxygenase [Amycolatopsis tucumanensis]
MRTTLCDLLGIEVPIISAPFGPFDSVGLAAAVCEAGGLGSLGTAIRPLPDLREQWRRLRERTARPFAINHTTRPFDEEVFAASLRARPSVISFHLGDPGDLVKRAHDAGCAWVQQVMDVDQARQALDRGADVLIAQGTEAGGHSGFIGTLALVPQVVDVAGAVPVVAAGGIADGRGLAAALALGAQGVAMGTRFLATTEMAISPEWKQLLVEAGSRDAVHEDLLDVLLPPYNRPRHPAQGRLLRTPFLREWADRRDELPERIGEIGREVVAAVLTGRGHEYLPFAGQSVGLIGDVRPAAQVVRDVVSEAETILSALGRDRAPRPAAGAPVPSR